jgi:serine/threonine-protein kinase
MIGVRLGSWVVEEEIGRGGMGAVYRARREPAGGEGPAQAAIKVLAAELAAELGFQQRFQREIDILRQLDHPNIVRFLESGVEKGRFWYAMELIDGPSFEEIREAGRVPWRQVLDLAWQVAPALKHAHDRGVVHRDIKPSNLLRAGGDDEGVGVVKLTDFGIASLFASPHLTVTGGVIGTPEYLSPEQAAGKPITRRSDLYSLGVVLYTLVTGTTPFTGEPVDLLHKHQFGQYERPSRLVPDLHPDFEGIIASLLEKDPGRRPPDAAVLFRRLDSLRKKLARQTKDSVAGTTVWAGGGASEGPATLMSRLMRRELEEQNRPGPVGRVLQQPAVLVVLFVLCVAALAWTFWPASAESLYRRGAALMASDDPHDWERAWEKYLGPLQEKYPDHPHQQEVDEFRRRLDDYLAEREAEGRARLVRRVGEGEWFFEKGLRLRQRGDEEAARKVWQALVAAYREVPAERPWVRRAEKELGREKPAADGEPWASLREAVRRAHKLAEEGKKAEADEALRGLKDLYRDEPAALAIIRGE